jgi:regulator of protease activity HflC (stomatin/prohibitin superfamily)
MKKLFFIPVLALLATSCAVIRPGQVGVKSNLGKLSERTVDGGLMFYNPFTSTVIRVPTRTINRELSMNLPSKEGLTIRAEVSILYRIEKSKVTTVIREIGLTYDQIITSVFRSSAADVCSQFLAKDMHSGERRVIEERITSLMNEYLRPRGFEIEAVLMKSITLPQGLAKAIEMKLEAEQDAFRLEYVLQQEQREAERMQIQAEARKQQSIIDAEAKAEVIRIEAEANKAANEALTQSLTPNVLKMRQIEALLELSKSPNTKTFFMDGKQPFMGMMDLK